MRIYGYCRVSSVMQSHGTSLADQQRTLETYAKGKLTRCYVEAESGGREAIEHRVQMQSLLDTVRSGDLVLCDKVDRWSRDAEFTYRTVREILAKGARMYFVGENIDPSTSEGDTHLNFRVLFAREEHKRIKQRMVGTRQALRDQGYYSEGQEPFGYRRQLPKGVRGPEKNVLIVDDRTGPLLRRAFDMCVAGEGIAAISQALGVDRHNVNRMLRSRFALGEIQNSKREWIQGKHPAIVDTDTWRAAQDALTARRLGHRTPGSGAQTDTWILRDVARCACGCKMSAAYSGRFDGGYANEYYQCKWCRLHVRVRPVEATFEPVMLARLESLRAQLSAPAKQRTAPARDLAGERARLTAKRLRYVDMAAEGLLTRNELDTRLQRIDAEMAALQPAALPPRARREALAELGAIARAWARARPMQRRAIVNALVFIATVSQSGVVVEWRK